ncbi:MAG: anaerobic sulfite reductase subunit AsrB [Treponema sp.]|nr:anaerobic sulfite reductase subunit AsrB [Treponema sp.]
MTNEYIPFLSRIEDVIQHTEIEFTFRMAYEKNDVKPGQFFEVSIPKFGEAPISVSGIGDGFLDLTIRKVGRVTNQIFSHYKGDTLFMRGPYGNGFELENYKGKELIVAAGGTGVSPVRALIEYFAGHVEETQGFTVIAGFKSPDFMLFKEDFKKWQDLCKVILTVDQAEEGYTGKVGLITKYIPELEIKNSKKASVIVVGPPLMMNFTIQEFLKRGVPEENIWISQERKMCCGIGKCGHCRIGDVYICLDGPVFNYSKGKNLID